MASSKPESRLIKAAGAVAWRPGPDGRPEILLVHRRKYDDWSLPKGKVEPRELVVQPGAPVRQVHQVEVAQPAGRPRRERVRAGPRGRRRDQRGRVGADRDAGALLVVLGRARPPVVVGDHLVRAEANGGDPGAAGVPLARPARQRGPLPGPVEPVRAGRVLGGHLVGLVRVGQRVDGRPHVPLAVVPLDHRVLDRPLARVARQHDLAGAHVELGRVGGVDDLDPPVLGPGGGAAQVQPPAAVRELDELRALERLGVRLVLGDHHERVVKVHAVGGEGDRHRVAAAAADRVGAAGRRGRSRRRPLPRTGRRPSTRGQRPEPGSRSLRRSDGEEARHSYRHQSCRNYRQLRYMV